MDSTKNIASKFFSHIGPALFIMTALTSGLQALCDSLPDAIAAGSEIFCKSWWYTWIISFAPLYAIGILAEKVSTARNWVDTAFVDGIILFKKGNKKTWK